MKVIATDKAPAAVGPYSQAVVANGFLFASGALGINPETGKFEDGFEAQAERVFSNLAAILKEAGMGFENVVKAEVFLTDLGKFKIVNEIYAKYFKAPFPARYAFEVSALPLGGLVEISVTATK
ncbi:MAG: Rid family detoxifying hydrolase [Candidatus Cloacimonadales bacterium]